jgi:hypothetical protein
MARRPLTKSAMPGSALTNTAERVRRNTDADINARIERQIERNLLYFADHPEDIPQRLAELDAEWDVERALEANAATATMIGVLLAGARGARYLLFPAAVGAFLLQHATQGWCPPLPVLRRLGFRTAREIERERNALKALRGDYDVLHSVKGVLDRAKAALVAATSGPLAPRD